MTLAEIIEVCANWVADHAGWFAAGIGILLSVAEFSKKIKFNPWSKLFGWIGDKLLASTRSELTGMKTDIGEVKSEIVELRAKHERDEALAARNRILRFADEVYQRKRHSKEYFDQILRDITDYNHYCDKHEEFENEQAVRAIARIEAVYDACMESNDFL